MRRQVPGHISLDDDCGVPRNRDESSGVANLIILTEHRTKMHLDNIMSGRFFIMLFIIFLVDYVVKHANSSIFRPTRLECKSCARVEKVVKKS